MSQRAPERRSAPKPLGGGNVASNGRGRRRSTRAPATGADPTELVGARPPDRAASGTTASAASASSPAVLESSVDEAVRLMAADGALIALLDEDQHLRFIYEAGTTESRVRRWRETIEGTGPDTGGLIRAAIETRRLQVTGDYANDESFAHSSRADRIIRGIGIRTLIVAPLLVDEQAIGVLAIYAARPDAFTERDTALARALADHAAASIGNVRLIDRLAASEVQLARRLDIEHALALGGSRLATLHDPADVLQTAVREAARLLDADGALLDLLDPTTGTIRWAYDAGIRDERHRDILRNLVLTLGEGMFGTAIADGTVLVTEDYLADPRFHHSDGADWFAREAGIASMIAAPLIGDGGPLGVLGVYSNRKRAYGPEEAVLAGSFASQATIALTNARLILELEESRAEVARRADAERTLREIGAQISGLRDREDVVQQTVDEAVRLLDADGARIDLVSDLGLLRGIYISGETPTDEEWPTTPDETLDQGVSGMAATTGRPFRTDDYLADDRFNHGSGPDHYVKLKGIRSVVAAPLVAEAGPIGAVSVWSNRPAAFRERHESLLEALATQATVALTNARLIDELKRSRREVERRADAERALREIAAEINSIRDQPEILQLVADAATRLLGGSGAMINLLGSIASDMMAVTARTVADPHLQLLEQTDLEPEVGVSGLAVSERRVIATGDYLADDRFVHSADRDEFIRLSKASSVVAAPLLRNEQAIGAITVYAENRDAFDQPAERTLAALADLATVAITNARLIEELAGSRAELARRAEAERSLRMIANRISAIHERGDVLQQVVDEAARLLGADGARIDLLDPSTDLIRWAYATEGIAVAEMERANPAVRRGEGIAGLVIERAEPFRTADYTADDRFIHVAEADESARISGVRSLLAVPLGAEGGTYGALSVVAVRPDAFDESDASLLEGLAVQASVALSNARLIDELAGSRAALARQVDAEQSLREIATAISAIRDQGSVLQRTVDEAARLLGADEAILELLDPDDPVVLRWAFDTGLRTRFDPRYVSELTLPVGVGLTGRAVAERRVLIANDDLVHEFPISKASKQFFATTGFRSMIAAPIIGESGALGAIEVYSSRSHAFEDADGELIRALATQAAIAISNARLIDELARSQTDLARAADTERALREIAAGITAIRDPDEVLQRIVDEARRLLGSDGSHLTFMADERTHLVPVVAAGVDDDTRRWILGLQFPLHGGLNGLAASLRRPVTTDDYLVDPRITHEPDDQYVAARLGIRGCAVVPLRGAEDEVIGTLAISYRTPREVREDEIDLLQVLADQASIAVTNARLDTLLRDSEARYRHLVENSPDLVWAIDADARFTFLSETCERLTGWRPDELIGGHFGGLVHPSSSEVAAIDWSAGLTNGRHELGGRVNLLHRDGSPIPAEFRAISTIEDGVFAGANGTVRDMSERDRLEREIRESEERYRYLVKASPDVVWAVDAEGAITFMGDRIHELTGWTPDEVIGRQFEFLTRPEVVPLARETWEALKADPTGVHPLRVDMPRKTGDPIPVEIWVTGSIHEGRFVGAHGSIRDMRENERLVGDLRRQAADLAAGDERAHLARELHDSVTQALFSMTLITRSVEVLLERDPAAAGEQLRTLRDLQRDALAEMRSLIFELRPGGLAEEGLVAALRRHAAAVQGRIGLPVVVEADLADRLPEDVEDALYRIAQEALHNVVKHAAARTVRLSIERRGETIRLAVVDDGAGFDAGDVPPGHLGLTGMRARAEKIGGRLTVDSHPGRGTRIAVAVPVPAEVAATA